MVCRLNTCTLTGVDETTPVKALCALSEAYPFVEWGILYSPRRQGQPGRYPSALRIARLLRSLPTHVRVALHLCGQAVPDLLAGEPTVSDLATLVVGHQGRLQFNLNTEQKPGLVSDLVAWKARNPDVLTITQHNASNASLLNLLRDNLTHYFLVDASGGRGIEPEGDWPSPQATFWGYAGGLGSDNLAAQLPRISAAAGAHSFWIDMEGKLRDARDRFDLVAAERCLQAVDRFALDFSRNSDKRLGSFELT